LPGRFDIGIDEATRLLRQIMSFYSGEI